MDLDPEPATIDEARSRSVAPTVSALFPPAARAIAPRSGVRPLEAVHIPAICDLFADTFRPGRKVRRADVEACLRETYLTSPGDQIRPASLVDVGADGRVNGFMGMITLAARHGDRTLRVGILGNFMARTEDRAKIGLRLSRATVAQDLDAIFTDTANQTSLGISRALKFRSLPLQSLEWVKILRPCGTAAAILGRSAPLVGRLLGPLARAADVIGRRTPFAALPEMGRAGIVDRAIPTARFAAEAPGLLERFSLRPDWTAAELAWLFDQASRKTRNGPLHVREVADQGGRCLGLYIMYAQAGGVAQVLQILARKSFETEVIGAVIRTASDLDAVAVRGAASPALAEGLMRQTGLLYHHVAASIVFTRHPELRDVLRSDEACLGGLFGEGWTRLATEEFA